MSFAMQSNGPQPQVTFSRVLVAHLACTIARARTFRTCVKRPECLSSDIIDTVVFLWTALSRIYLSPDETYDTYIIQTYPSSQNASRHALDRKCLRLS